jgi:hypothetical protein
MLSGMGTDFFSKLKAGLTDIRKSPWALPIVFVLLLLGVVAFARPLATAIMSIRDALNWIADHQALVSFGLFLAALILVGVAAFEITKKNDEREAEAQRWRNDQVERDRIFQTEKTTEFTGALDGVRDALQEVQRTTESRFQDLARALFFESEALKLFQKKQREEELWARIEAGSREGSITHIGKYGPSHHGLMVEITTAFDRMFGASEARQLPNPGEVTLDAEDAQQGLAKIAGPPRRQFLKASIQKKAFELQFKRDMKDLEQQRLGATYRISQDMKR